MPLTISAVPRGVFLTGHRFPTVPPKIPHSPSGDEVFVKQSVLFLASATPVRCTAFAVSLFATVLAMPAIAQSNHANATRPNIVWIMSEDNSKHYLKHFDINGVETPAIESMAAHGITFDRAFSNAPVCSVARSTLITGCYGPRIGAQFHRRSQPVPLPEGLEMFPVYLRDVGYYTTNNSKTDYNAIAGEKPWDESSKKASWKNRPEPGTPFFHVETHADSHESRLHFGEAATSKPTAFSQDDVHVPPYLPDTKLVRFTAAYYRDRISAIDAKVAQTLEELKQAGELENTFVFYFGDHGGVLPRSKGYLFEAGLHVPFVVRVPEKYRELTGRELGSRTNGFVSFIDFAPTVLSLAGVEAPEAMDGIAFLGRGVSPASVDTRDSTFSYADRMDEKYDLVRAVRVGNWKYIRYFEAQYPNALDNEYRYNMLAYQQWQRLASEANLAPAQLAFFRTRPVEALFDLSNDPDEVENLASSAEHGSRLMEMRKRLMDHLKSTNDLSFFPEAIFLREGRQNPVEFGAENAATIAKYIDTVNIALMPWGQSTTPLIAAMNSGDPWVRYWAFCAASSKVAGDSAARTAAMADESLLKLASRQTLDSEPLVAARAVEFLAILGKVDPRDVLIRSVKRSQDEVEALQVLNIAAFIHANGTSDYPIDPDAFEFSFPVDPKGEISRRLRHFADSRP
ncbi:sulfatase-like hydrolase/transferase [Aporhodopirellula aestuarii]|uniref:Sulfatase n=1 Tax=Aporhodopirellula aestuarii TaxID=2950107 RepID=A0ABT0UBD2_9BACT|nr:sulfatase [Aporhodopirellula aestuarii]MCM2374132.1 sulfatase [Aporhodopirellula aestuarii]